jgi:mannosyltransferase
MDASRFLSPHLDERRWLAGRRGGASIVGSYWGALSESTARGQLRTRIEELLGRGRAAILAALVAVVTLALVLRLYRLDFAYFWNDELFSVGWSQFSIPFLWGEGMRIETNPPLYYQLLHWWMAWVGQGVFNVRLLGVLVSAATVPVVYLLGVELGGRRLGLLAALLFAIMPIEVSYAQEARGYALLTFMLAMALLGLAMFRRRVRSGGSLAWPLLLHVVGATGAVYTHATAVFALAAMVFCIAPLLDRRNLLRLAAAESVVALLGVPEFLIILQQTGSPNIAWIAPLGRDTPLTILVGLAVGPVMSGPRSVTIAAWLSCWLLAQAAGLLLGVRTGRANLWLLAGIPVLFIGVVALVSLKVPMLLPRVTVWLGVPLCLFGATLLARARWFALPLGLAVLLGLYGVYDGTIATKEDWPGLLAQLRSDLPRNPVIALGPFTSPFGVSLELGSRPMLRWEPTPEARNAERIAADLALQIRVADTQDLAAAISRGGPVWLILRTKDRTLAPLIEAGLPPPKELASGRFGLVAYRW